MSQTGQRACPQEGSEAGQAEEKRDRDKESKTGHLPALPTSLNEFATTITELSDMAMAATSGVT